MKTVRIGTIAAALLLAGCALLQKPAAPPTTYLLFFHESSAQLTPEAKTIVDQAVAAVRERHPSTITVAGYTTNVGTPEHEREMAEHRVKTVQDTMIAEGVDPKLFLTIPIGAADDNAGKTGDRRIEIRLSYGS